MIYYIPSMNLLLSWRTHCLRVFSQAFVTDFSYHGNTMYYSLCNISCFQFSDPLFVAIENKGLRKVLKCSECNIRDKNILFLPCTHHSLCEECAEKATKCPVCGSEINRKIKTYMS